MKTLTPGECYQLVERNGMSIKHLSPSQATELVCLIAVRGNGMAIQYMNEGQRTDAVCLAAVSQNSFAIQYLTAAQRTIAVESAARYRYERVQREEKNRTQYQRK